MIENLRQALESMVGKILVKGEDELPTDIGDIRWDPNRSAVVVSDGTRWRALSWDNEVGEELNAGGNAKGYYRVYLNNGAMKVIDGEGRFQTVRFAAPNIDGKHEDFSLRFRLDDPGDDDVTRWWSP